MPFFHLDPIFGSNTNIDNDIVLVDLTKNIFIKSLLEKLNLDSVIFFSPGQLFDILFVQLCNELNINTIYFQHGISLDFTKINPKDLNKNISIKYFLKSLYKFCWIYFGISSPFM